MSCTVDADHQQHLWKSEVEGTRGCRRPKSSHRAVETDEHGRPGGICQKGAQYGLSYVRALLAWLEEAFVAKPNAGQHICKTDPRRATTPHMAAAPAGRETTISCMDCVERPAGTPHYNLPDPLRDLYACDVSSGLWLNTPYHALAPYESTREKSLEQASRPRNRWINGPLIDPASRALNLRLEGVRGSRPRRNVVGSRASYAIARAD